VEAFGEKDVAVRTIPVILGEAQTRDFVRDVIAELETGRDPTAEKKRTSLLQTACKHAVKGGEALTEEQIRSLLDEMIEKKVTPTCPHGRPLVVAISHRDLDKKFKRIQA
jgi:DNA mismatch repair protein MutL